MTDDKPNESIDDSTTIQPVPEVPRPAASDAVPLDAGAQPIPEPPPYPNPVAAAAASYDPQPLAGQQDTSQNWMGIVALITAIIGMNVVAIVFAILGINAVKNGKANNKGLSIAAIIISVVYFLFGLVLVLALVVFAANADTSTSDAAVGKCYTSTVVGTELQDASPTYGECTDETNAQVYYIGEYSGSLEPDDPSFTDDLYALCISDEAVAFVDEDIASEYYVEYYIGSDLAWTAGDREVVCSLYSETGPIADGAILND